MLFFKICHRTDNQPCREHARITACHDRISLLELHMTRQFFQIGKTDITPFPTQSPEISTSQHFAAQPRFRIKQRYGGSNVDFFSDLFNALPGALAQGLIWGIMAIGVYITFKVLDLPDLTVDGTMCTGGAVCVMMMLHGYNVWVALLVAFLAGLAAGALTGLFHTAMGIPAILAGILSQLALYSINLRIMDDKANQAINPSNFDLLVSLRDVRQFAADNPILVALIFTAVIIALLYWFFGTELGSGIRATGANPNMARAQGINTNANVVLGLMVSNGLVALSGGLLAQFQGSSDINMGRGAIVIGLAAVIIGEVAFGKVFINFALKLLAVSIGAVIYYIVLQIVLQLGLNTNDLKLVSALIVAVFLAIPYWKGHIHTKKGGSVHA